MDLAIGAKQVFVLLELQTRKGERKLVAECSYPLTGLRCVSRVYTDVGVFALAPQGPPVIELVDGLRRDQVTGLNGPPRTRHTEHPRDPCLEALLTTATTKQPP